MKLSFSVRRLWLLIRHDFLAEWHYYAYMFGISAPVIFLLSLQQYHYGVVDTSMHQTMFGYALFIWGIWATSHVFHAIYDRTLKEAYLLLPASTLEKILARLLPLTVGFGIVLPVYFIALSIVIEYFNLVFFGVSRPLFNPFDPGTWEQFGYYIIVQSLFFLGAVWFKGLVLLKTVLALVFLHIGLTLIVLTAFHLNGDSVLHLLNGQDIHLGLHVENYDLLDFMLYGLADITIIYSLNPDWDTQAKILRVVLVLLPPVLWWVAWLRLREVQANDGI